MTAGYHDNLRTEMMPFLPGEYRNVLEVGCGEGRFLASLPHTLDMWGIEPNPEICQAAASRIPNMLQGTFEAVRPSLPDHHFDLVICNDVIEHMQDHEIFLDAIKAAMAPGGYLVGSIPNVRYYLNIFEMLLEKDWHYRDSGILDRTHLRFFTEKSLRRSLIAHGFTIEAFSGINAFRRGLSPRDYIYRPLSQIAILCSLGYWRDIQFLQFGFRARLQP